MSSSPIELIAQNSTVPARPEGYLKNIVMHLEPEIAAFVDLYENFDPLTGDDARDAEKHRDRYRRLVREIESEAPVEVAWHNADVTTDQGRVPIRVFQTEAGVGRPCCLFFHGGGWMLGDLDTHHSWAADLCAASGATVIAVDYRLAPENSYPAAFHDCYAVLREVVDHPDRYGIDPGRVAVYGDSAGGNLGAAVGVKARDDGLQGPAAQVLIYPALHQGEPLPSWETNREAPVLSLEAMNACWRAYLRGATADVYAAPLLTGDFSNLPPAWIVTAEHDPLRDDGLLFADRLADAGVDVEVLDVEGLVHGCFRVRHLSAVTRGAFQWSVQAVREGLAITP